jgi:DNA-binding NarL/FixJ family response regulator
VALLILSAYNDEPYLVAALEAGVNGYLLKSADAEEIVRAVHAVAQGESILDQSIVPSLMRIIAVPAESPCYEPLSERELAVLDHAAHGLTNRAIAIRLKISHRTVQGHLRHIFDKLDVANRTEAVVKASQLNLLRLPR